MGALLAGAACRAITPDRPQWLDGYGSRSGPSEGVYQDITVKALALRLGESQALLVSAEVLSFSRARVPGLKARIAARTGVPPEAAILTATHTHCAPRVCGMIMPGEEDPEYVAWFEEQCVEAAAEAYGALRPARACFSRARDEVLGINRRVQTPGGVMMRPNPAGPRDAGLDTLWLETADARETIASLTAAGCHPTCRGGPLLGGDYPGFLMRELERAVGGVGLFVLGCAGDVRPRFTGPDGRFRMAELPEVEAAARRLAQAVLDIRHAREHQLVNRLRLRRTVVEMPLDEPPSAAELARVAEEDASPLKRQWARGLLEIGPERLPRTIPFEMQALELGYDLAAVFWPGEIASEYALWLKSLERPAGRHVLACAYANGTVGYVPSAAMVPLGGYEVNGSHAVYNLPAPYAPDIERRMREATLELLESAEAGG